MDERWNRTEILIGEENLKLLKQSKIMVVGCGGVGAMAAETLARSAVGNIVLIDKDKIDITNLNRQIMTLSDNVGREKTEVMRERILAINPDCNVTVFPQFFSRECAYLLDDDIDFVIDAIDTISCKLDLIQMCQERGVPFITCLGMANRIDPSKVTYSKLRDTNYDPVARIIREQVRKRKMKDNFMTVFSSEQPLVKKLTQESDTGTRKEQFPLASMTFVPNAAGILCGSYAVRSVLKML